MINLAIVNGPCAVCNQEITDTPSIAMGKRYHKKCFYLHKINTDGSCRHLYKDGGLKVTCVDCGAALKDETGIIISPARYDSLIRCEEEQVKIVEYMRVQYKAELERGDHAGMSISEVIIRYLARERRQDGNQGILKRIFG